MLAIQNQNLKKKKIKPYKNCKDEGISFNINSKSRGNADIIDNETTNKKKSWKKIFKNEEGLDAIAKDK